MLTNKLLTTGMLLVIPNVGWTGLAQAQSQTARSPTASAQSAESSRGEIEEIVVTGERIARGLKDTASSVYVTTSEDLERQAAPETVEDVLALIPNVTIGESDSGPTIRGQDTTGLLVAVNAFLGGSRARTTTQVDGRALSYDELIYGQTGIWDAARVEVFRGPQTTTQGVNSIAGAIFIETREPTFDPEFRVQGIVGNHDTERASAALSGPLVDGQLAARLSVDYGTSRPTIRFLNVTEALIGIDPDEKEQYAARGKLLYTPAAVPALRAELILNHGKSTGRQVHVADRPFTTRVDGNTNRAIFVNRANSATLRASYDFTEDLSLSATGTLTDIHIRRFARPGAGTFSADREPNSIESILDWSPKDGPVSILAGVYASQSKSRETSDFSALGTGLGNFRDRLYSSGVFTEATFRPLDRLSLTSGGRFQRDRQDRQGALGRFAVDFDETFEAFLPKFDVAYDVTEDLRIGATARRGFNPGGTTISFTTGEQDTFEKETLWSYEVYARAGLGAAQLFANLFYTDYTDAQRALTTVENGIIMTTFSNAPRARSYGAEISAAWDVTDKLSLRSAIGLLRTKVQETVLPTDPINGREFQRSPHFTASGAIGYAPIAGLRFDLNGRYSSGYFSDDRNTLTQKIDDVFLADANLSYAFRSFKLFGYVRNLFDKFQVVEYFTANSATINVPREYGVGLEVNF